MGSLTGFLLAFFIAHLWAQFGFGYHWLHLATIDLVGDNREFEV